MNTTAIDPSLTTQKINRTRAVIRNSAGQIIFDSSVDMNWKGYIVRMIQEIHDGNDAVPIKYREFTGTYEIVLVGVGGVIYTLNDNQDHLLPSCLMQKPGGNLVIELTPREAIVLCFHDNVAEFYD